MQEALGSAAKVRDRIDWTNGLFTLRTDARREFVPGQYVAVGLDGPGERVDQFFSIASAPHEPVELLVARVENGGLTTRLDNLAPGDEIRIDREPRGRFVLDRVPDARTLWMFATGTGLAPYISMLRTETPWERFERIVVVHGARRVRELPYREELATHSRHHRGALRQLAFITREEPDAGSLPGRMTAALAEDRLSWVAGTPLVPDTSQVMLCGNPDMIREMTSLLTERGFRPNRAGSPGHITTEQEG